MASTASKKQNALERLMELAHARSSKKALHTKAVIEIPIALPSPGRKRIRKKGDLETSSNNKVASESPDSSEKSNSLSDGLEGNVLEAQSPLRKKKRKLKRPPSSASTTDVTPVQEETDEEWDAVTEESRLLR
jgi:hypothetical protein